MKNKHILARAVTWNLAAQAPPSLEDVRAVLLPVNRYHLYFIGTEECERSIAASAINPSKRNWELYLQEALGDLYMPLRAHTLQAMHLIVYAHRGIMHLCSDLTSGCIATGMGMGVGTLGNKGAVAVNMRLCGTTTLTVVNSHLAAHQNAVKKRNEEFRKIHRDMPSVRGETPPSHPGAPTASSVKNHASSAGEDSEVTAVQQEGGEGREGGVLATSTSGSSSLTLSQSADRVIFMGDMNYRIRGNRTAVDSLLMLNMHEVMLHNDQLQWSMEQGHIPAEYTEGPLNFKPTYKFDFGSNVYDSDKKQRIPSWTDRVLYVPACEGACVCVYVPDGLTCTAYNSDTTLKTSDHRPVYASFKVEVRVRVRVCIYAFIQNACFSVSLWYASPSSPSSPSLTPSTPHSLSITQVSFDSQHAGTSTDDRARQSASIDFQSKSEVCSIS
eukprot:GSChrysophyteH2.ASY1.ANO1.1608.1 assembled CDS